MSCAKMAEPTEMRFGMLNQMGSGDTYYMGRRCPHGKGHFGGVWPTEKHGKV